VKLSLLQGSLAGGLFQHDILRDYAISRIPDLRQQQREMVHGILNARPEDGWPPVESVDRGSATWYVANYLWWHIRGAVSSDLDDIPSQEMVVWLIDSDVPIAEACAIALTCEGMLARVQRAADQGDYFLAGKLGFAASLPGRHGVFPISHECELLLASHEHLLQVDDNFEANKFELSWLNRLWLLTIGTEHNGRTNARMEQLSLRVREREGDSFELAASDALGISYTASELLKWQKGIIYEKSDMLSMNDSTVIIEIWRGCMNRLVDCTNLAREPARVRFAKAYQLHCLGFIWSTFCKDILEWDWFTEHDVLGMAKDTVGNCAFPLFVSRLLVCY
jgi:hypothetical protein